MKVITIALGVFIPVYIHTHNGLRTIDAATSSWQRPSTSAAAASSARRAARCDAGLPARHAVRRHRRLLALVVVEQINATSGIGYMITLAKTYGQTDVIVVGLVVYGALGLLADGCRATRREEGAVMATNIGELTRLNRVDPVEETPAVQITGCTAPSRRSRPRAERGSAEEPRPRHRPR